MYANLSRIFDCKYFIHAKRVKKSFYGDFLSYHFIHSFAISFQPSILHPTANLFKFFISLCFDLGMFLSENNIKRSRKRFFSKRLYRDFTVALHSLNAAKLPFKKFPSVVFELFSYSRNDFQHSHSWES